MLRIRRSPPSSLFFEMTEKPRDELLRWAHRDLEDRRQRRAPIDYDMFRAGHLVDMVVSDFHGCCAFCEREIGSREGASHFRPLTSAEFEISSQYMDHYAWLAYEWLNLFLICRRCERFKSAWPFPISNRRAHFLATFDEVRADEKTNLIDPTIDTPTSHISYLMSGFCSPNPGSLKGSATVSVFALNDEDLVRERKEAINSAVNIWQMAIRGDEPLPKNFLVRGSHRGTCRNVISRTLSEFGIDKLPIQNGQAFVARLQALIGASQREKRDLMIAAIDLLRSADDFRMAESKRREMISVIATAAPVFKSPIPALRSPYSELASIHVSNFRAIDSVDIPFSLRRSQKAGAGCLLLLGENAVGKSTCLAATALALMGTSEARKLRLRFSELVRSTSRDAWDVWDKKPIEVAVNFHDGAKPAVFAYDPVRKRIDGTIEQTTIVLGYGPHRYFANAQNRRSASAADRVRSLFDSRRALPDPTEWLMGLRGSHFNEVARTVRTILPIGDDDHLVNDPRTGICVYAQGQFTPITQLSEGYRSVFAMVADMCRAMLDHWSNLEAARAVVLIDEIETHLHPRWKMRVMSSLRRAFPKVQFIVTTHDPLCVRGMDDGEVVVLARDDEGGVQRLQDLPAISGMRAEQLLTSEYFGLSSTIDPEIHLEIARLAQEVEVDPESLIDEEAARLVERITVGDSATAQIIHAALFKYLREREQPTDGLSTGARPDAVLSVLNALRSSRAS